MKNSKRYLFGITLIGSILTSSVTFAVDANASDKEQVGNFDLIEPFGEDYSFILSANETTTEKNAISTAQNSDEHLNYAWEDNFCEDYSLILNDQL